MYLLQYMHNRSMHFADGFDWDFETIMVLRSSLLLMFYVLRLETWFLLKFLAQYRFLEKRRGGSRL